MRNPSFQGHNRVPKYHLLSFVLLGLFVGVRGGKKSLSWQTRTAPSRFDPVPSLIESSPSQVAQSSSQLLGGELGEVCEQTQQQEHPQSEQDYTQEEDEPQRATGRPLCLSQVRAEDGHFLHEQKATQAEDEDVLGHLVASPHHVCFEARDLGLVFVQDQQGLH